MLRAGATIASAKLTRAVLLAAVLLLARAGALNAQGHAGACADCHVSRATAASGAPLWSTKHTSDGLPLFTLYHSRSFDALHTDIRQPDGVSRLCLGCHDGSYPGLRAGAKVFGSQDLVRSHLISCTCHNR